MDCKEFLEKAIELSNQIKTLMSSKDNLEGAVICAIGTDYIQVRRGITILHELFDKELLSWPHTNPAFYYFDYGGKKIIQYIDDPLETMKQLSIKKKGKCNEK